MQLDCNLGTDARRKGTRQYQIQEIWDRHQEILRRLVLGQSGVDIARDLGISPVGVSYVRNSELGRKALAELHSAANDRAIDVSVRIKEVSTKAMDVLENILDKALSDEYDTPADRKTAASVAMGLMDRAGYAPVHKQLVANVPVSSDVINEIKEKAKKAGIVKEVEIQPQ